MRGNRMKLHVLLPRPLRWTAALLVLASPASAAYDTTPALAEITAQAGRVDLKAPPVAASRLAALLPKRCATQPAAHLKLSQGHAEAQYGSLKVLIDDFAGHALNTVLGAAFEFGLHEHEAGSALVRPVSGALGYSAFTAAAGSQQSLAQTRVWVRGRYVVQILQPGAHSRAQVDACLQATGLAGLGGR
ncbi:hypothetical protein ACFFLM_18050 [Deinococcus oregonensis]|uniref:Uncharacterized protein n=1 Tax=Deinococcus oregonensis TaxID=1805970 RepID=A0ABV6B281_9DEIO